MAQENQDNTGTDPKMFTQEELDAFVAKRVAHMKSDSNPRVAELETELQRIKDEETTRIQSQLEEQGEYKKLNEGLKQQLVEATTKAQKIDSYNELLESTAQTMIEEIPEDLRTLVPDIEISQKLGWLRTNKSKLVKPTAPKINGEKGAGGSTSEALDLTDEDRAAAKKLKMSEEDYAKYNY